MSEINSETSVAETAEETTAEVVPDYDSLSTQFNEPEQTTEETPTSGTNPAWNEILQYIPEQLHEKVTPHLSSWDKNFQKVQQEYAPYKQFVEQGISPDLITNSLTLAQAINANPQAVYDEMREKFGLSHEQAIEAMEDADESQGLDEYGDEEDGVDVDLDNHPLVQQLREQQEQLLAIEQERQREAMMTNIQQEVNREWAEIESLAGGKLSENIRNDIMQRALAKAGDTGMPKLMDGFREHIQFVSQIRNSSANNSAPSVADGNGLLPTSQVYDKSTAEGRQAYIADFVRTLNSSNGG